MILSSWILTLLVAQLALGFDHSIDLGRCYKDTACFVRESCIEMKVNNGLLVQYKQEQLKLKECDVIMQIKMLSEWKLHVMMQVKLSGSNEIKIDDGIKLVQGSDQFVCKPDGVTGATTFHSFKTLGRQIFEDQHLFCSFVAEVTDKSQNLYEQYARNAQFPRLIITKDGVEDAIMYSRDKKFLWGVITNFATCDYTKVTSSTKDSATDTSVVLTEVDTTLEVLRCNAHFVIKKKSEKRPFETSNVTCDYQWKYDESGTMRPIGGDFEVHCAVKRCRLCKTPPPRLSCPGCTVPTYTGTGAYGNDCPILTCATGKLTVSGQSTLGGEAECKRSVVDPTVYTWFVGETELEKAACLVETQTAQKRHANTAVFEDFLTRAH